jgi:alpha-D-xyloside xylohydrolase
MAHGVVLVNQAKIITLTGGGAGQGFSPLEVSMQSFHIGDGVSITVQGVTFAPELPRIKSGDNLQEDVYQAGDSISAGSLGFSGTTPDDANMIQLLREFRYAGGGEVFNLSANANYVQYVLGGLNPNQTYQLDLFTVSDNETRCTQFQVMGGETYHDNVETTRKAKVIQYKLTPDAVGNVTVRYGFGGSGEGGAGLLSAVSLTTSSAELIRGTNVSIDQSAKTVTLTMGGKAIRLQPWADGTLRVMMAAGKSIPESKSFAVISAANGKGWEVAEDANSVRLQSKLLRAVLSKQSGLLSCYKPYGLLFEQKSWSLAPAKDKRDGVVSGATFSRTNDEHFYGAGVVGEQLRNKNAEIQLLNNNTEVRIPVLYSSHGYSLFWDNPARGKLKLSPDAVTWEFTAGDAADFYVMAGANADAVVSAYRTLTGGAPLFPKWAYGFWFSKNKFNSQKEILDAAKDFRDRDYPVDLIIQDYYYWKPDDSPNDYDQWGSHQFVANRYPDPKGMVDQLHNQYHMKFMTVIWPRFDQLIDHAKELIAANAMLPNQPGDSQWERNMRFYDPFGAKGRKIYGRQVMDSLWPLDIDAWWMDAAEPEMSNDVLAGFDTAAGPGSRVMSAYPLLHTEAVYQAQRAADKQNRKRVVLLPRSAWAGMQRNAAINWTGDIYQDWSTLAWQIEGLQNYSIAGLPYITTDVGGYEPTAEADRELFIRWFEWGAFCPIFRVHGVGRPFPWEYGVEAEPILKKFLNLRYRLLPYIYSNAALITNNDGTMLRPLVMDFADDPQALGTWDEFMFGPSLLVCPVYQSCKPTVSKPNQFVDKAGKSGQVTVTYLKANEGFSAQRKINNRSMIEGGPSGEQNGAQVLRVEMSYTPKVNGNLALEVGEAHPEGYPVSNVTIDGNPVTAEPLNGDWQFPLFAFQAKAGVPVHFSFETKAMNPGILIVKKPDGSVKGKVYFPGKGQWYDFWTGKQLVGGNTLTVNSALDIIPLYVRAGAIIPMGPESQYVNEKPTDPIELRVYRGANGELALYEDEGDNYNYTKGMSATIPIKWDEQSKTLTIGARKGEFPRMLKNRIFNVVFVSDYHGIGEQITDKYDAQITYDGNAVDVKAP